MAIKCLADTGVSYSSAKLCRAEAQVQGIGTLNEFEDTPKERNYVAEVEST